MFWESIAFRVYLKREKFSIYVYECFMYLVRVLKILVWRRLGKTKELLYGVRYSGIEKNRGRQYVPLV